MVNRGVKTSIEAATVAGDFRSLLNAIVYVEPNAEVTSGGVCPYVGRGTFDRR